MLGQRCCSRGNCIRNFAGNYSNLDEA